jgi:hypothetical protein
MPDRLKGKVHPECFPLSIRLGVGHGANDPTSEKILLRNHGGDQDPHGVAAGVNKKKSILIVRK